MGANVARDVHECRPYQPLRPLMSLIVTVSPDIREWIDIVTGGLTAVGTVGAVIVALYFSRRDRRQKLSVRASIIINVPWGGLFTEGTKLVSLTATNTGFVPITVTSPCWRIGLLRPKVLYQSAPPGLGMAELAHGQVHAVAFQVSQFLSGWHYMRQEIAKYPYPALGLWSLRCGFDTTIGKKFFGPLNWELKKVIRDDFYSSREDAKLRRSPNSNPLC
jgi:hypothetical protein